LAGDFERPTFAQANRILASTTMTDDQTERDDEWRAIVSRPLDIPAFQPLSSAVGIDVAAASSSGKARSQNTDHYLVVRFGRLQETMLTSLAAADLPPPFEEYAYAMMVADGLDEEGGGARASRLALSTVAHLAVRYGKWNVRIGPDNIIEVVEQSELLYREVNNAMREASKAEIRLADMAASLTAVYIAGADLFYMHVGHSRAYLFRNGVLIPLTTDHTLEQLRREAHKPTLLDQAKRDQAHVLIETLGGSSSGPGMTIEHVQLLTGDRVILCTNGLTDVVSADTIADVLAAQRRPAEECQRLVDLALAAGGPDNVTVLVADYWVNQARRTAQFERQAATSPAG
jgi:PPM family protein phosphatase